jgi:very-short-patch-repair endonuclease
MSKLNRFKIETARRLRTTMTDEERILWPQLWRPVEGTHFRKQASLGPYYVDFVSHRLKLIMEVDGAQHALEPNRRYDDERTLWLEGEGYRVLRFWNHEVKQELEAVLDTIYAAVEELRGEAASTQQHPTPALTRRPSPLRGG